MWIAEIIPFTVPSIQHGSRTMPLLRVLRKIAPALLCVTLDYYGLGVIAPVTPFYLRDELNVTDARAMAAWSGATSTAQFGAIISSVTSSQAKSRSGEGDPRCRAVAVRRSDYYGSKLLTVNGID